METIIKRYFYKDDFTLLERCPNDDLTVPFSFLYYTEGAKANSYIASFDGTTYKNCKRNADGSITVIFRNHGMAIGNLVSEKTFKKTSSFYGSVNETVKCAYNIELSFHVEHLCEHKGEGGGGTTVAYGTPQITLSYAGNLSNNGGTLTPTISVTQLLQVINEDGTVESETTLPINLTDTGVEYEFSNENEDASIADDGKYTLSTASVSADEEEVDTVTLKVKANGKEGTSSEVVIKQDAATLALDPAIESISAAANSYLTSITIRKSNGVTVTASSGNTSIATVSITGNTLTVNISANAQSTTRSTNIVLTSNVEALSKTIPLTQDAASCSFANQTQGEEANANKEVTPTTAGTVTLTSASSNQSWVTASISNNKVKLNIQAAADENQRTATITVGTSVGTKTFTLTQSGIAIKPLYMGHNSLSASAFASLTVQQLLEQSVAFDNSPAQDTCNGTVHFIMVKEGVTLTGATLKTTAGLDTPFSADDIMNPAIWKRTHNTVTIYNKTYSVYGYYNAALSGSTMIVKFTK